jgi:hypothetical protein
MRLRTKKIPRGIRLLVASSLTLIAVLPAGADEATQRSAPGLFAVRPMLPGKLPFLVPEFTAGSLPRRGESRWRADLIHASTLQFTRGVIHSSRPDPDLEEVLAYMEEVHFSTDATLYYFDGETTRLDLGYSRGMPGGWELAVTLPLVRHSGGFLDEHIDTFHDLAQRSHAGRELAPPRAGAMVLLTAQDDYVLVGDDLPAGEIGDLTLAARFALPPMGERLRGDLRALVELPTGDPRTLAGSGEIDFGASLSLRWSFARSRLTFGAGYVIVGGLEITPDLPMTNTFTGTLGYEYRLASWASIVGQFLYSTSPYRALGADGLSDAAGALAIGPRFDIGRRWVVDVALVEDMVAHNADLDIGFLVSLVWRPARVGSPP